MNKTKMCVFSGKCFKEKYFYNQTRPDLDNMADFSHWAMAYISDQQMSFQFNNCIEKVKGDSREENFPQWKIWRKPQVDSDSVIVHSHSMQFTH